MLKKLLPLILLQLIGFVSKADFSTDTILSRYRQYLLNGINLQQTIKAVEPYAFSLNEQKQWSDIDYTDTSPSYWKVRTHLDRVATLAVAYEVPNSAYYKNEKVWKTLSDALDHWLEKRYKNSNWWHNEIGTPQAMRFILLLIANELKPAQLKQALEVLAQYRVRGVGANLIWSADLAIHYGALVHDEKIIKENAALIAKEIKVSTGEGIQPDYSFHQHESRLQQFQYGQSFLTEAVRIGWELRGTEWALPQEKINILTDFILRGSQWMARGINIIPGTIDRASSRVDQLHNADIRTLIPYLRDLNPAKASAFTAIAERQNGKGKQLEGFKYFPYSDFSAYQQKDFSFFIKTISTRTLATESINFENLKGRLLNNGDAYFITNGNQYYNLMPVWNWKHLPSQTNSNLDSLIVRKPFAGSVTDGQTGMTAMDYSLADKGKSITAHKFWACNNNVVVCLTAHLQSTNITDSIFTTLDQSRWTGTVEVNRPGNIVSTTGKNEMKNVNWIYHANIGYINLVPSTVQVHLNEVSGAWSDINSSSPSNIIKDKIFMPLLYHSNASNSSAGYIISFSKNAAEVNQLATHPTWKIVRNDSICQAIVFKDETLMAAFFTNGTITNKTSVLTVDKPCLIQISTTKIFVSDPSHSGLVVNVKWNNKTYAVKMNSDGSTLEINLQK